MTSTLTVPTTAVDNTAASATYADEAARWDAFTARDVRADGAFIVAVRTTRIYCRPSCPARRPLRHNVTFYGSTAEASAAGYRACLRCLPDEAHAHTRAVEVACTYLDANLDRRVTLAELGEAVGMSPHHLQRIFARATGVSPRAWVDARRIDTLKTGLRDAPNGTDTAVNGGSVTRALYDAGYSSSSRLYEQAPSQLGMTPGTYQRGGLGAVMHYSIVDSALNRLLVAMTERGVSAVYLGDDDAVLERELRAEYPAAEITRDDEDLHGWVAAIVEHLAGDSVRLDLPLDVQATAFKRRVWQELQAIPYGATRTYSEVAEAIGNPTAVRAVAHACATNPVSIVIPCHRVVRRDGSLAGYRWGLHHKERLLAREQEVAAATGIV